MEHLTTTPFGQRPVTACLIKRATDTRHSADIPQCDKWQLFRALCTARKHFDLSDRDLTVLNALLSFHKGANLCDNTNLVVFPSNNALSERAHGMAESTLRRHLAALVRGGVINRHDSPNGKRYASRNRDGQITRAFGLDLRPLLQQARRITEAASVVQAEAAELKQLRENLSLMKRDASKLAEYGVEVGIQAPWDAVQQELSVIAAFKGRKLDIYALEQLGDKLRALLYRIRNYLSMTENMSGSDIENGRHYQSSNKDSNESEPIIETTVSATDASTTPTLSPEQNRLQTQETTHTSLPLGLVLKACPDLIPYATEQIRHWHQLIGVMTTVRGFMGITQDAWDDAKRVMGAEAAAITVAAILQRIDNIRSPGGYLRSLTQKSAAGGFSPGPMIMALLSPARQA